MLSHLIQARQYLGAFALDGTVLATGDERVKQAEQRAQFLAERLRAMGVDPDAL